MYKSESTFLEYTVSPIPRTNQLFRTLKSMKNVIPNRTYFLYHLFSLYHNQLLVQNGPKVIPHSVPQSVHSSFYATVFIPHSMPLCVHSAFYATVCSFHILCHCMFIPHSMPLCVHLCHCVFILHSMPLCVHLAAQSEGNAQLTVQRDRKNIRQ